MKGDGACLGWSGKSARRVIESEKSVKEGWEDGWLCVCLLD